MQTIRLEVAFNTVARLIQLCYGGAKSRRTVKLYIRETVSVNDYWDGGSRSYCQFVDLNTGSVKSATSLPQLTEGNLYGLANGSAKLAPGQVAVEHSIFCGKDMGYRIYAAKETLPILIEKYNLPINPNAF